MTKKEVEEINYVQRIGVNKFHQDAMPDLIYWTRYRKVVLIQDLEIDLIEYGGR